MKNKTIICIAIIILLSTMTVSATNAPNLPKGKCTWTRPASLSIDKNNMQLWDEGIITSASRPVRTFQGVYGRFSDGSIRCFTPNSNHHKDKTNNQVCHQECTEKTCTTTEECNTETICNTETTCHYEWECKEELTHCTPYKDPHHYPKGWTCNDGQKCKEERVCGWKKECSDKTTCNDITTCNPITTCSESTCKKVCQ